jgi:hypothetical protein
MKTRNGFVSNSSSSSFVILTTVENHEAALKNLHPYIAAILKALETQGELEYATLFGKKCVSVSCFVGNISSFEDAKIDCEPPNDMCPTGAFQDYVKEIEKDRENTYVNVNDC